MKNIIFGKKIITACAFLTASFFAGSAHSALIDFDNLSIWDDVTTQYAADGVVFSGMENGASVTLEAVDSSVFSDVHPVSPPTALSNFYDNNSGKRADAMVMTFASGASNIEFDYNGAGSSGVNSIIKLYDLSMQLISSFTIGSLSPTPVSPWFDHVVVGGTGIGRMEIHQPSDGWGHYIDNLSFDIAAIPEPGGIALFALGLLGLSVSRRRQKLA